MAYAIENPSKDSLRAVIKFFSLYEIVPDDEIYHHELESRR